jgi:Flp pilus assembly pilin Flp
MFRRFYRDQRGQIATIIMIIALAIIAIAVVIAVGAPVREMLTDFGARFTNFWAGILDRFGGGWGS